MRHGKKEKAIVPETIGQHIEEEFKKSPEFRKSYADEVAKLNIAHKIMMLRKQRHLSQVQLAKRMRTSQQTISRLENPRNERVTLSTLNRVAAALKARLNIDFIPQEM